MGIETDFIRRDQSFQRLLVWVKGFGMAAIPAAAVLQSGVENPTARLCLSAFIAAYTGILAYIDRTFSRWSDAPKAAAQEPGR